MRMLAPVNRRVAPWHGFRVLEEELERLFGELKPVSAESPQAWAPAVDLREDATSYYLEAELPGIAQQDLQLSVEKDVIFLKGARKREEKKEGKGYLYSERAYGSFERSFGIPEGIDADRVTASFEHGVLRVTIPKPEREQAKKIEVKLAET